MNADDEHDYYGELWGAIREQERIVQARKLVEGLRCLRDEGRQLAVEILGKLNDLMDENGMEVSRRRFLYERSVVSKTLSEFTGTTP